MWLRLLEPTRALSAPMWLRLLQTKARQAHRDADGNAINGAIPKNQRL